jgi:hypothetical protein
MNFPDQLLIRIVDSHAREPVPGLAIKVILVTPKKNNYTLPVITNASGNAILTKEAVRKSIEEDWTLFPMDYESELQDCSPEIEIHICSPEDIRRSVEAMKLFGPSRAISAELLHAFEEAINHRYFPTMKRINIEEANPFELEVNPK